MTAFFGGWFPARAARRPAIGSTPSSGMAEVIEEMAELDQRRIGKTAARIARALEARQPATASVATVLNNLSDTLIVVPDWGDPGGQVLVNKTGSGPTATYKLTREGLKLAHHLRPREVAGVSQA